MKALDKELGNRYNNICREIKSVILTTDEKITRDSARNYVSMAVPNLTSGLASES